MEGSCAIAPKQQLKGARLTAPAADTDDTNPIGRDVMQQALRETGRDNRLTLGTP